MYYLKLIGENFRSQKKILVRAQVKKVIFEPQGTPFWEKNIFCLKVRSELDFLVYLLRMTSNQDRIKSY